MHKMISYVRIRVLFNVEFFHAQRDFNIIWVYNFYIKRAKGPEEPSSTYQTTTILFILVLNLATQLLTFFIFLLFYLS